MAVELSNRLSVMVDRTLPSTLTFEHPTLEDLTLHLVDLLRDRVALIESSDATTPGAAPVNDFGELAGLSDGELTTRSSRSWTMPAIEARAAAEAPPTTAADEADLTEGMTRLRQSGVRLGWRRIDAADVASLHDIEQARIEHAVDVRRHEYARAGPSCAS